MKSQQPADQETFNGQAAHILVAGGGTAGHIEPAMAVADALRDQYGARVTALGTTRGLETDLVPARGFPLATITAVPIPRKPSKALLQVPGKLVRALRETRDILRRNHIDCVVGFGSYVSAPAYLAAKSLRIPFVVHEANARAGLANKLGVALGGLGLNAQPESGLTGEVVGLPVRNTMAALQDPQQLAALKQQAAQHFGLSLDKPTLLVTGGSQGAVALNEALAGAMDALVDAGVQVVHAYGKKNAAPSPRPGVVAVPYIERMDLAYAIADLVVCRSGAMTVAEITASRTPAVYVPLPHGNGEQALNARSVVAAGGAQLVNNAEFTADYVRDTVVPLVSDPQALAAMRTALAATQTTDAATAVADRVMAVVRSRRHR
ncbi:undecaprenyldiphospho-muramoylpentapeptide beta-N-acetylglucosaminyltransferase [Corynebacterium choanae]|uniref:undecaprenyldiphospho-muramoylpentapeptide beta-N-acetylglucosaminyltransferase n=1 Tax=Corynebacterium choanae TaxID=1862358 RepID=UPI002482A4B1|nr:undecaprenyldiphospho-muramoylpentapeptide beta-N-acetylglucosaminyltransferase [Corynebacterium choanae]